VVEQSNALDIEAQPVLQARTNLQAEGPEPLAALAQLTTFLRCAKEDFLLQPADAAVTIPEGSPTLPELLHSSNAKVAGAAKAVLEVMDGLGKAMQSRYVCAAA
jgi:hypothetical protein